MNTNTKDSLLGEKLVSFLRMNGYRYAEYIEATNHINIGSKPNEFVNLAYENGRFHVVTEASAIETVEELKKMSEELRWVTGNFDMIVKITGTMGYYTYK